MANTLGEKELRTEWNDPDNIGEEIALVADKSFVPTRNKAGI